MFTALLPSFEAVGLVGHQGAYGIAISDDYAAPAPVALPEVGPPVSHSEKLSARNTLSPDFAEIIKALEVFASPDHAFEIRALGVPIPNTSRTTTYSHVFRGDQIHEAAQEAARLSAAGATGVYVTLNPVDSVLFGAQQPTRDCDIARRQVFFIDCDPTRPSGVSATDAEKAAALATMQAVRAFLQSRKWPDPVVADSGNGWHLLYFVNLPTDDDGLASRTLEGLADQFDTGACAIDRKVFNLSRICKLYGTVARKGPNTSERPHRLSRIIGDIPWTFGVETVSREQMEALASEFAGVALEGRQTHSKAKTGKKTSKAKEGRQTGSEEASAGTGGRTAKRGRARRDQPASGKRTGDVEKLAAKLSKLYPVRRRGERHGQMCGAVGYLVSRGYNDQTIVAALKLWHTAFHVAGLTGTDPAAHAAETIELLTSTRSNPGFGIQGPREHAREAAAVSLPLALKQALEPSGKAKRRVPRGQAKTENVTPIGNGLRCPEELNSGSPEQIPIGVTFLRAPLCRTTQEQAFVEALVLAAHHELHTLGRSALRFTHDQIRAIAWELHGLVWDNKRFDRLKAKYVDRLSVAGDGRTPASRHELLREIAKGERASNEPTGVPSEYEPTGLRDLLALWDVPEPDFDSLFDAPDDWTMED